MRRLGERHSEPMTRTGEVRYSSYTEVSHKAGTGYISKGNSSAVVADGNTWR